MTSIKKAYRDFLNTPEGVFVYRQFKRLLYARQDSLVQWLNTAVILKLPATYRLGVRICDIGGGDGDRITRIVQFINGKLKSQIRLDFVEQSALYISEFDPEPLAHFCRTIKHHCLFEDVSLPPRSYDIIFLIHSIFAFGDLASTQKILSLRKDGGAIVIVSNAPNSFLGGLKRLTDHEYVDKRFEVNDLEALLRRMGIRYRTIRTTTEWAISKRTWKHDIGVILNWISLGCYSAFPKHRKKEINNYIKRHCRETGARTFFREEEVVIVIPRSDSV